jgi:hypothetical protein
MIKLLPHFLYLNLQKKLGYRETFTIPVDEDCLGRTQCACRNVSSTRAFQSAVVYLYGMNDLLVSVCWSILEDKQVFVHPISLQPLVDLCRMRGDEQINVMLWNVVFWILKYNAYKVLKYIKVIAWLPFLHQDCQGSASIHLSSCLIGLCTMK